MIKKLYKIPEIDGHSNLEIQIANGCNLTCQSCSHYTNVGGGKNLNAKTVEKWISNWNEKIVPKNFIIMGGEPTLNKNLVDIAELSATMWPMSKIKIITNGFFLHNHQKLPLIMQKFDIELEVSIKSNDEDYVEKINPTRKLINDWKNEFKFKIKWREDHKNWLKIYHGYGSNIKPFEDKSPKESFESCGQKVCRVLHEGDIWKCPRLAYLHIYKKKFELDESWGEYLRYKPLKAGSSMKEIKHFFEQREVPECAMCPAKKHPMILPSPMTAAKDLLK
jgi:MoaA/NifB/PqqE/SkfB family radical SAM enzyme